MIAASLCGHGIRAGFLHAGVTPDERARVSTEFSTGILQTIVSTSSLEMGVNLPARLVVIFDSYCFDGEEFGPMPMQRYLQMSGRAGRAGLDPFGRSVLLMPSWSGDGDTYLHGHLPAIRSGLFSERKLRHEILSEVASRFSISRRHLETNFAARTLWRAQGGNSSVEAALEVLLNWKLLNVTKDEDGTEFLTETALGRIALQMAAPPATVATWRDFYKAEDQWRVFDLILRACLMEEVTPRPGFNFEEIDVMGDILLAVPSALLDLPTERILVFAGGEKRLLSAVKAAAMMFRRTQGATFEELAEEFDTYAPDLRMLAENVEWTLEAAQRVFAHLARQEWISHQDDEGNASKRPRTPIEGLCSDLRAMLRYGVPGELLTLVEVPGIGSKRALKLHCEGIRSLEDLLSTCAARLAAMLRLRPATAEKIRLAASKVAENHSVEDPFATDEHENAPGIGPAGCSLPAIWPIGVDPYRLRRAFELKVDHCSEEVVRVSGGTEPHVVRVMRDARGRYAYACDCADFAKGTLQCKHVIRARLERNDARDLLEALRSLKRDPQRALRLSMGELWMKAGGIYDAFHGRTADYGRKFLSRALNPAKPR